MLPPKDHFERPVRYYEMCITCLTSYVQYNIWLLIHFGSKFAISDFLYRHLILVATSGDTGGAVLDGFSRLSGIILLLHYHEELQETVNSM